MKRFKSWLESQQLLDNILDRKNSGVKLSSLEEEYLKLHGTPEGDEIEQKLLNRWDKFDYDPREDEDNDVFDAMLGGNLFKNLDEDTIKDMRWSIMWNEGEEEDIKKFLNVNKLDSKTIDTPWDKLDTVTRTLFIKWFIDEYIGESMLNDHSLKQFQMIRKLTKGIDIGDRIPKMKGANLNNIKNNLDHHIETMEEYWRNNKNYKTNGHLGKGYQ